jgi:hypothetical protein
MKSTSNAQRPTSNPEIQKLSVSEDDEFALTLTS